MNSPEVLYVVNSSLASPTGGGRTRVIAAARQATESSGVPQEQKLKVRILCFCPPQHFLFNWPLLAKGKTMLATESGCPVHYVPSLPLTRIGWLRTLNNWHGALFVALWCWWFGIGIAHGHGLRPTIFALLARWFKRDLRVVADVHGATTAEYLYEREVIGYDDFARELESQERFMLSESSWLIFVSEAMRAYYESHFGMTFPRSSIIPCATESNFTPNAERRTELRREHDLENRLVICYVGACESYQLPDQMCLWFRSLQTEFPQAYFLVFSHHREAFLSHFAKNGFTPGQARVMSVRHDEIFDLLQMADLGLLLRDQSVVNRVASPTKFAEYCLCGVPVLAADGIGDVSTLVERHQLGLIVDPETPQVNESVRHLVEATQTQRSKISEQLTRFAREHFSWNAYGAELRRLYRQALSNSAQDSIVSTVVAEKRDCA
jgi:glycosyltransferase involved in cell wall biosynthesis